MANIGTLTVTIDGETFKLQRELKKAEKQVTGFTKKGTTGYKSMKQSILSARSAVIAFGAVNTLIIGKIFGDAVKQAGDFQESLGKINSLLEDSNLVFGDFRGSIIDLSKEFGRSKTDLAQGLKDIIDATIPTSEALDVLRESTKLSVGGFTDVSTATSAVISTFQLYRNELRDVADASDFLFATQKRGRLTLEDLAKNIGTVIGVAKSAGVSLEDLGVGFASISRVAGSASKTATQFRALINVFTKQQPIESQRLAFEKFGVTLNSTSIANGKFIDSILKFKDASAEELSVIFRRNRALRAATAIINQAEKKQADLNGIVERAGITNRTTADAQELYNQQLRLFVENINDLKVSLGGKILPALTQFTNLLITLKEKGLLSVFFANPISTTVGNILQSGIEAKLAEAEETKKKADAFLNSFGNLTDLRGGLSKTDVNTTVDPDAEAAKRRKSDLQTFKTQIKDFQIAKDKVSLSNADFAIAQLKRESDEFKILVDKGLVTQKEFETFRTNSIQRIKLKNSAAFQAMFRATQDWADGTADMIVDWAHGAEISFANVLESFSRMIMKMAIQIRVIQPLMQSLFGASVVGGTGSGLLGSVFTSSGAGGFIGSLFGGGSNTATPLSSVTSPQGAGINPVVSSLGLFADGGVATKPTAGIFGEAGKEALIPLDRFKDFQGGGSNVEINIIGAPEGTRTEETETDNGKSVNVILDEQIAKTIRPGTKTFQKLGNTFANMNPKLTGR